MARGGVNKAVVQIARTAILARGEHPSIDAVRIEMGNTGSKTTIHRYLKELDEVDTRRGVPQEQIGDELTVSAYVDLGSLTPEDVTVEVGYGRVSETDHIHERSYAVLEPDEPLDGGRQLFSGPITIDRSGPFGYTVRVLPRHAGLASPAELSLVSNAAD